MAESLEPERVERLQRKLYEKAKREPGFRFYSLHDKVCWRETLALAYRKAKANGGAPGFDGESFADISAYGEERWLAELREELLEGTYEPRGVRRKTIPKPGGGDRPLGIPTIRDRVVQTAAVLILEPIFEADFEENAYMNRFLRHWRQKGASRLIGEIVSYADDFVILCRTRIQASDGLELATRWLGKLGLRIHPEKTRLCHAWEEPFDFLGYTFGSFWWWLSKGRGLGVKPSKKAVKRLKGKVNALLYRSNPQPWPVLRTRLNRLLIGWANYFSFGATHQADNAIWWHVGRRVRRFLCKRHKLRPRGASRFSQHEVYGPVGVVELARYRRQRRNAHALS